jgi:hypothetical protein
MAFLFSKCPAAWWDRRAGRPGMGAGLGGSIGAIRPGQKSQGEISTDSGLRKSIMAFHNRPRKGFAVVSSDKGAYPLVEFFLKLSCRPVGTKKNENTSIMLKSS